MRSINFADAHRLLLNFSPECTRRYTGMLVNQATIAELFVTVVFHRASRQVLSLFSSSIACTPGVCVLVNEQN